MTFNITPILQAAVTLLAAVITVFIVPYIKSKTTASQQAQINALVQIAVFAAEQIFTASGKGKEKKEFVLFWLRERGIFVDDEQLDAMIEAAVYNLNKGLIRFGTGVLPECESEGAYGND